MKLPTNWARIPLRELGSWVGGGTPSKANSAFWTGGTLPWVSAKDMKSDVVHDTQDHITRAALRESSTGLAPAHSVLVVVRSGILRRTVPIGVAAREVAINQDIKALIPSRGVLGRYVAWALRSCEQHILHELTKSGTTVQSIEFQSLLNLEVPVAPLAEQRRIVAAIEEHLSRLDAAVAGLKRVQAQLPRYRAAVLKAAVEGSLLGEAQANSDELPRGWNWLTVEGCAANESRSITDGPFGSNLKTEHYTEAGPRVVRLQNIGDGEFVDARAHISEDRYQALKRHAVFPGDVLIAALGENPPRACLAPEHLGPAIVKADCIRLKPNPALILPGYLNVALNAHPTRRRVSKLLHGVGRPRLNLTEIRSISLPVPPLPVQVAIVAEVERRLSLVRAIAATVEAALARAARARQSVLRRAFSGRLVPQDPSDEPASVLLERIRAGRSSVQTGKKPRQARRTTRKP